MRADRHIIRSPQAAFRLAQARQWLSAQTGEVLVLGPNWEAADDLVRGLAAERGALFAIHRLTLDRLMGLLAADALATEGLVPLSSLAAQAVAARAIFGLRGSGRIEYFEPIAERPGFPRAVAETVAELRQNGIDPIALAKLPPNGPALAAIMAAVESELSAARLIDRAGLIGLATAAVARGRRFVGIPILLLDPELQCRGESALLAALAAHAPAVLATIPRGDQRSADYLAAALEVSATEAPPAATPDSLALLQEHLFEPTGPERSSLDESVTIASAPGESRECVEIARAILAEAARGVAFDRMAVLLHAPAQYVPHLEEAFDRAQIPAYYAAAVRRPEPAGRALLALLACAAEGLSARRFAEYLSLAQVPEPEREAAVAEEFVAPDPELTPSGLGAELELEPAAAQPRPEPASERAPVIEGTLRAPWRWEELLVEASVINSRERWERRLAGLSAELQSRRAEASDDEPKAALLDRQLRDLEHLRQVALPIIQLLAEFPRQASWGEWLRHLRTLVARAVRDFEPVMAVLAELEAMAPVGPVELEEVRLVLSPRLGKLVAPRPRRRYGCVFVGPALAARAMAFDVVLVPGLAERLFPQKVSEDPLLPDVLRTAIDSTLLNTSARVARQRLALKLAVGAAGQRLYLSFPRIDLEQGRPRVPSFYALEALRAAEGYLPGFYQLADRAAAAKELRLGWPAPAQPEEAIDEAEFDIAQLQRLLDLDPETQVGAAHYLLQANPHLARALRARGRRWLKRWTPNDGLVDPEPEARAALARHQFATRSFSATALQHYAECPYRFLLQAIHRLEPREELEPIEVIDPLTRGALFHEVQYELLSALRGRQMLPLRAARVDEAQALVDELLTARAELYRDKLAPAILKVWEDGIASIRADLREWLRRLSLEREWNPERFELSFGLSDREQADPASSAVAVALPQGLQLRGSIDLVEANAAGALRVTDHKTGRVRAKADLVVGGGRILQPMLYALAAERLLAHPVQAGRLYYCTAAGGFKSQEVALEPAAREKLAQVIREIDSALTQGFLPAAPADRECQFCDYRPVCGPHEALRSARKPPRRIEGLLAIRKLP